MYHSVYSLTQAPQSPFLQRYVPNLNTRGPLAKLPGAKCQVVMEPRQSTNKRMDMRGVKGARRTTGLMPSDTSDTSTHRHSPDLSDAEAITYPIMFQV